MAHFPLRTFHCIEATADGSYCNDVRGSSKLRIYKTIFQSSQILFEEISRRYRLLSAVTSHNYSVQIQCIQLTVQGEKKSKHKSLISQTDTFDLKRSDCKHQVSLWGY